MSAGRLERIFNRKYYNKKFNKIQTLVIFMIISFFEEFPSKENLDKLKLIDFNTKLYLAASSFEEFNNMKLKIKNKFVKEFVYWPILKKEEGYWISPFSSKEALNRIFNELKSKNTPVMLDLEIPFYKNLINCIIRNVKDFSKNKALIKNFINGYKNIYVCEYYPAGNFKERILNFLGLSYNTKNTKKKIIRMMYHSLHRFNEKVMIGEIKINVKKYKDRFLLAYGIIASGVGGINLILSFKQLDKDLSLAKDNKVKEAIIFRLGGLNKKYLDIIKKYV